MISMHRTQKKQLIFMLFDIEIGKKGRKREKEEEEEGEKLNKCNLIAAYVDKNTVCEKENTVDFICTICNCTAASGV
jgi:hypothetical protein